MALLSVIESCSKKKTRKSNIVGAKIDVRVMSYRKNSVIY